MKRPMGFYYLVVVSFTEEVFFRGFLYGKLKSSGKEQAIIYSGILWGMMHAIVPIITIGLDVKMIIGIIGRIISFTIMNHLFVYLYDRCDNILILILIHALLDNS